VANFILNLVGSVISIASLMCTLIYFLHFNFSAGIIRLVYLIFVACYPIVGLIANLVIANNFKNNVLKDQDKNPENAEFLDFEDDEDDILRKAKIRSVKRKVAL
jgi:hypothetical protein